MLNTINIPYNGADETISPTSSVIQIVNITPSCLNEIYGNKGNI